MFLCQAFNQFFKFFVPMVEISSSEMSKLILIVFFSVVNRHNPQRKKNISMSLQKVALNPSFEAEPSTSTPTKTEKCKN